VKRMMILLIVSAMAVLLIAPAAMADSALPAYDPMPGFNQPDYLNPAFDNPDMPVGGGTATAGPTASPTTTASPTATANASPTATATASPEADEGSTASSLPKTGSPSLTPAVTLVATLALVVGGIAALRLVLRRGAAS
jgi:hypothetical protein